MAEEIVNAFVRFSTRGVSDVQRQMTSLQGISKNVIGTVGKLAAQFTALGAAAATAFGVLAVRSAGQAEAAMADVRKTTGLAGDELDQLEANINRLGSTIGGIKLGQLREIAVVAGQLGLRGVENITNLTKAIGFFTVATDESAEESARSISRIVQLFKLGSEEALNVANTINKLGDESTATAGRILFLSRFMATVGATFKLTAAETLAFAASAEEANLQSRAAASSIRRFFIATSRGGPSVAKLSVLLGQNADATQKLIDKNPAKALQLFIEALGKLEKGAQISAIEGVIGNFQEGFQVFTALANRSETVAKNLKTATDEWIANSSAIDEANIKGATFFGQLQKLANVISIFATTIGKALLPAFTAAADSFASFVSGITEGSPRFQSFVETIERLSDAIGGLEFGGLSPSLQSLVDILQIIIDAVTTAIPGFQNLIDTFSELAGFAQDVQTALTPFEELLQSIAKGFVDITERIMNDMIPAFKLWIESANELSTVAVLLVKNWEEGLEVIEGAALASAQTILGTFFDLAGRIGALLIAPFDAAFQAAIVFAANIIGAFVNVGIEIKNLFVELLQLPSDLLKVFQSTIEGLGAAIGAIFSGSGFAAARKAFADEFQTTLDEMEFKPKGNLIGSLENLFEGDVFAGVAEKFNDRLFRAVGIGIRPFKLGEGGDFLADLAKATKEQAEKFLPNETLFGKFGTKLNSAIQVALAPFEEMGGDFMAGLSQLTLEQFKRLREDANKTADEVQQSFRRLSEEELKFFETQQTLFGGDRPTGPIEDPTQRRINSIREQNAKREGDRLASAIAQGARTFVKPREVSGALRVTGILEKANALLQSGAESDKERDKELLKLARKRTKDTEKMEGWLKSINNKTGDGPVDAITGGTQQP